MIKFIDHIENSMNYQFYFQAKCLYHPSLIIHIIKLLREMSFYYFLQTPLNNFASMQPIYYIPPQFQQTATNLILINSTNPSQMEQKQNFILQSNITTRDSLPQECQEKSRPPKNKKILKKEKDENFGWRNQNKDRNILSNILKAFINYLLEHQGMKKYIEGLTHKLNFQNGVSGFYSQVELNFPLTKSYISPKQLKTFLNSPSQPANFIMIFKIALKMFLRVDYGLILMKSMKIKRRSKLEQMKKCRELISLLFHQ